MAFLKYTESNIFTNGLLVIKLFNYNYVKCIKILDGEYNYWIIKKLNLSPILPISKSNIADNITMSKEGNHETPVVNLH